ncbi:hypothetical protein QOZ98_001190 [Planomicrobium stackebrandtii]|uniref:Uncharacterized protein n=1 Tax=Planomicrobium stackebrandtii TaxID=253160 RepID=A0ABU0GTU8_9BACL|nr:hypothetical protein [Planomicrobium stackebrandtii]
MLLHERSAFLHDPLMFLSHYFASLHEPFALLHGFTKISILQCHKDPSLFVSDVCKKGAASYPRLFDTRTASIYGLELCENDKVLVGMEKFQIKTRKVPVAASKGKVRIQKVTIETRHQLCSLSITNRKAIHTNMKGTNQRTIRFAPPRLPAFRKRKAKVQTHYCREASFCFLSSPATIDIFNVVDPNASAWNDFSISTSH